MAEMGIAALQAYWQRLAKRERIITFITVGCIFSFLCYQFPYSLQERSIRSLKTGITETESDILSLTQQIAELKVRASELKVSTKKAPVGWDLVDQKGAILFLEDVWGEAKRVGVNMTSVHPSQELDKEQYKELSMNLDVKARYRELAIYFKRLENLSRLVSVRKIRVESCPDSSSVCAAQFEAVTYMSK